MSIVVFGVAMAIAASAEEALTWHVKARRAARRLPKRARQYKFN